MKTLTRSSCLTLLLALVIGCSCGVSQALAQSATQTNSKPSSVRFRPQTTGTASVRVTGGSRGNGDAAVSLDVLIPDEVGLTTQEQPSLFWFQSKPSDAKFELTVLRPKAVKPLLRVKLDQASKAGIQRLKLSDHGLKLDAGTEYQWVVALITDAENRSTDLVASGYIKRVAANDDLKAKLTSAAPTAVPAIYAEAGIWYDVLATLSDQIDAAPANKELRQARSELLAQVGLKAAAQSELPK